VPAIGDGLHRSTIRPRTRPVAAAKACKFLHPRRACTKM
jgi:hypothetical protein